MLDDSRSLRALACGLSVRDGSGHRRAPGRADTRHTIERTKVGPDGRCRRRAGGDSVLLRPSQAGLAAHFEAVSAVSPLPVAALRHPGADGAQDRNRNDVRASPVTLPNLVGVKDAAGDVVSTARLVAQAPSGFEVYCGDDLFTLPMLAVGAVGIVSVSPHTGSGRSSLRSSQRSPRANIEGAQAFERSAISSRSPSSRATSTRTHARKGDLPSPRAARRTVPACRSVLLRPSSTNWPRDSSASSRPG